MRNIGVLIVRIVVGCLMAGHGAQKLFGWFGGHGLKGTASWMESMNMRPGKTWALMAGVSEFGGGLLTALGFLNPLGSLGTIGAMGMATAKAHWGKPIWETSGGAELPAIYAAVALGVGIAGPGDISLDKAFGIRLPRRLIFIPGLLLAAGTIAAALKMSAQPHDQVKQPDSASAQSEAVKVAETASAPKENQSEGHTEREAVGIVGTESQAKHNTDTAV